ncbi:NTP transferase domain-containing protein [Nitrosopumilus sp.]|uniref:NTP transferase domain-containing protein n=1 Tax=Nitrosopumilus sp. TaxID=2024843 RepID=UPI00260E2D88|nr:NTP transferase domain-containing protein [Nitrosopumilus sp.]
MIGIIMAGGKGSRMNLDREKLLLKYKKPVILHVVDSLKQSNCFSKIIAITSSNSPQTKQFLEQNNIDTLNSSGDGYVEDLNVVLQKFDEDIFVTSGDLPLLDSSIVQKICNLYDSENIWTSILVSKQFLDNLGTKSDFTVTCNNKECSYSGISMINSKKINSLDNIEEKTIIIDDKRIGLNLNTKDDYLLLGTA